MRDLRWRVAGGLDRIANALRYGGRWPMCRECWFPRSSGRHKSVAECSAMMAHACANPEEHHCYRFPLGLPLGHA